MRISRQYQQTNVKYVSILRNKYFPTSWSISNINLNKCPIQTTMFLHTKNTHNQSWKSNNWYRILLKRTRSRKETIKAVNSTLLNKSCMNCMGILKNCMMKLQIAITSSEDFFWGGKLDWWKLLQIVWWISSEESKRSSTLKFSSI